MKPKKPSVENTAVENFFLIVRIDGYIDRPKSREMIHIGGSTAAEHPAHQRQSIAPFADKSPSRLTDLTSKLSQDTIG